MAYSPIMPNMKLSAADMGVPDYADALRKGFQTSADVYKPRRASEDLLAQMLANKMNQPKAERADEFAQADLNYKNALSKQAEMGLNPFNRLSGVARDAYSIELLRNQLGENHPAYQSAKQQYDLEQESTRGLNDYRQMLAQTMNKRSSSNIGKLGQEEEDVAAGFEPNTNRQHQISSDRQEELLGQYRLAKQKAITDTDTRKKVLFASNIDKTIDAINTKDLTQFGGLNGKLRLKQEEIKAATTPGTESEGYRKYLEAANKAQVLAKQVRQFYGDSIQPAMLAKTEQLANPATWKNNPEIAERLFKSFTSLLKQETGTYRGALKSTREYEGRQSSQQPETRTINGVTYKKVNGEWHS